MKTVRMVVKQVRWQEVVISDSEGYEVPDDLTELFEFCESIKSEPLNYCQEDLWTDELSSETSIVEIKIEENK